MFEENNKVIKRRLENQKILSHLTIASVTLIFGVFTLLIGMILKDLLDDDLKIAGKIVMISSSLFFVISIAFTIVFIVQLKKMNKGRG